MSKIVLGQPWPERLDSKKIDVDRNAAECALRDAENLSEALIPAAAKIPALVAEVKMSDADRRAFEAQALTLRDQSRLLKRVARHGDVRAVQMVLSSIDETCSTCHTRFRDYSGLLGPQETRGTVHEDFLAMHLHSGG